jgi:hypothetical protein
MTGEGDGRSTRSTILAAEYTVNDFEHWQSILE